MEYAELIDDIIAETTHPTTIASDQYMRHVGFSDNNPSYALYFSADTIKTISTKVTQLLTGVDPKNRRIIVPDNLIVNIMNSVYENYRPPTGDIYGRYNVPTGTTTESYVVDMIDQAIEIIVTDVKNNYEIDQRNSSLSIWDSVLGDFNAKGLRSYAPIKTRVRRPAPMQFNMNY